MQIALATLGIIGSGVTEEEIGTDLKTTSEVVYQQVIRDEVWIDEFDFTSGSFLLGIVQLEFSSSIHDFLHVELKSALEFCLFSVSLVVEEFDLKLG